MGKASRDKGKRGELEVVHQYEEHGYTAHRTSQVDGTLAFDVAVDRLPIHNEVKRYKRIAVEKWLEKAEEDALADATLVEKYPLGPDCAVWMRQDHGEWMVLMRPDLFFELIKEKG